MSTWHPNLFENEGRKNGYAEEYLLAITDYGRALHAKGLPVIFSLGHLACITDTPYNELRSIVSRNRDPYKQFMIRKRSGGYRQIVVPDYLLLKAQRWIHQNILQNFSSHPSSFAYNKGSSIKKNADVHCNAKWLVKIDISRFFESISERQVFHVFHGMGYTKLLSLELTRLCTRVNANPISNKSSRISSNSRMNKSGRWKSINGHYHFYEACTLGHLPQGAPTSPLLSNLVFIPLDIQISDVARKYKCSYSRYSDDLTFSSNSLDREKATALITEVSTLLSRFGFRRHSRKTHIIPPGARKIVTGLVVNGDTPKVTKELRESIENHLYYATRFSLHEHCARRGFNSLVGFKNHLKGKIQFVASIDPCLGSEFLAQFGKIDWPEGV
ncbi:reverse transcriptase family protein [Geomonas sp. Red276]